VARSLKLPSLVYKAVFGPSLKEFKCDFVSETIKCVPEIITQLSPEEEKAIIAGFDKPDQVQANGIRAGGVKYFTLQAGEDNIYGKKGVCYFPFEGRQY